MGNAVTSKELLGFPKKSQMAWIEEHMPNWYGDLIYFGYIPIEPVMEFDEPSECLVGLLDLPIEETKLTAVFWGEVAGQGGWDAELYGVYNSKSAAISKLKEINDFIADE